MLRNTDESWMAVAQKGVEAFIAQAMDRQVPFATETVFSHWRKRDDGTFESKIDRIRQMQAAGYFVVLFFVGLTSFQLSIARVQTRITSGGHAVPVEKLVERFPRTQTAVTAALNVADAAILADNSRELVDAFTVCHIRVAGNPIFDSRDGGGDPVPPSIAAWLDIVCPRGS
jgi:predicted ABC-type ATPase